MSALRRCPRLIRTIRCLECRQPYQPWALQRRHFTPSVTALLEIKAQEPSTTRQKSGTETKAKLGSNRHPQKPKLILGQSPDKPIRTRFAPSPTGYLHLGSLRTALFNNLASKATNGGAFILRIEDTDQKRFVADAEERIIKDLKWLGLEWSEGPDCGGPHGPYRQSERLETYKAHVQQLIDQGFAYRCFCKDEDLEKQKLMRHEAGLPTTYPGTCRSVDVEEAEKRAAAGESHTVRFYGDKFKNLSFKDAIYGRFQKREDEEDFIILKTDGYPTYHLANVVDDHLMGITHVVRGEEWLISTPKHLALYKAFGWEPPTFAHLGLLTNPDGTKLSKRNISANVSSYQEEGLSPMAMQSWLANLGSSFQPEYQGVRRTVKNGVAIEARRTMDEVVDALSWKFTKGGIKLNPEKLESLDVFYHRTILTNPLPTTDATTTTLHSYENNLIEETILRPMLSEVHRLTPSTPGSFTSLGDRAKAWETSPKYLIDVLKTESSALTYLRKICDTIVARYKKRGDMQRLVSEHPHYFFRPPERLIKTGLTAITAEQRAMLEGMYAIAQDEPLWSPETSRDLMNIVQRDHLPSEMADVVDNSQLCEFHRFICTGSTAPSHGQFELSHILGREEFEARVGVVKELLAEMDAGGEEMRERWIEGEKEWSSEA